MLGFMELNEALDKSYPVTPVISKPYKKTWAFVDGEQTIIVSVNTNGDHKHIATSKTKTWQVTVTGMSKTGNSGAKLKPFKNPLMVVATILEVLRTVQTEHMAQGFAMTFKSNQPVDKLTRLIARIAPRQLVMTPELVRVDVKNNPLPNPVMFLFRRARTWEQVFGWVTKTPEAKAMNADKDSGPEVAATIVAKKPPQKPVRIRPEFITSTDAGTAEKIHQKYDVENPPADVPSENKIDMTTSIPSYSKPSKEPYEFEKLKMNMHDDGKGADRKPLLDKYESLWERSILMFDDKVSPSEILLGMTDLGEMIQEEFERNGKSAFLIYMREAVRGLYTSVTRFVGTQYVDLGKESSGMADLPATNHKMVVSYTGNAFHEINAHLLRLSDQKAAGVKPETAVKKMDEAFSIAGVKASNINPTPLLMRGMKNVSSEQVRTIINTKTFASSAYMSTTSNPDILTSFGFSSGLHTLQKLKNYAPYLDAFPYLNVMFIIDPENVNVLIPNGSSKYKSECEFIINRGTTFDVTPLGIGEQTSSTTGSIVFRLSVRTEDIVESESLMEAGRKRLNDKRLARVVQGMFTEPPKDERSKEERKHANEKFIDTPII